MLPILLALLLGTAAILLGLTFVDTGHEQNNDKEQR